jgi:fructokinase
MTVQEIVQEVAEQNPQGFTFDICAMRMVCAGIVAAYAATQDSFGAEGLERVIIHATNNDGIVGGWQRATGELQYDSCRVFADLQEALAFGREQQQLSIYDINTLTQYDL